MGGAAVIEDDMVLQAKVEYIMVALILPIMEGVEQGQVVVQRAGMCQAGINYQFIVVIHLLVIYLII